VQFQVLDSQYIDTPRSLKTTHSPPPEEKANMMMLLDLAWLRSSWPLRCPAAGDYGTDSMARATTVTMIRVVTQTLEAQVAWTGGDDKGYDGDDLFGGDRALMIFGAFTMDEQLMETGMMMMERVVLAWIS
jgi:hypothetical protein